ncbi:MULTISPECIES: hypothetical protein [Micromonospora]|uniref:Uncharacterized protein n=1 Tax=Micromonospora vinacea TaxID=709878 RepID=A0ABS0JY40_9ACTN|nr:hypothetical protein [Micromonospora vinacea]MBG6101252.1 hypothetical protein [Micromonospora vinacea]WSZ75885.1 hypothetical protein OH804_28955 [Micromonospora sp. NBC_00860]
MVSLGVAVTLVCGAAVGLTSATAIAAASAPTDLKTAGNPCASAAPGPYLNPADFGSAEAVSLQGTHSGTPRSGRQADFQVWDVTDPARPQQWLIEMGEESNTVYVQLEDSSRQLDGVTYAWRVRVLDGADASPWSNTCHFTVDRSGGPAPTVTSTDYPVSSWGGTGAIGVPGTFTLTPASADTVSYLYEFHSSELPDEYQESSVDAVGLGGPAVVTFTPKAATSHSVTVYAVDRAGNRSERTTHPFYVKETRPEVFSAAYPAYLPNQDYNVGVPGAFDFRATVAGTASFAWRIDEGGPSGAVPADASGKATAMIAPTRGGQQTLYVHSVTQDGTAHAPRAYTFAVDDAPVLTGDTRGEVTIGSSLTIHLAPRAPQVVEYLYWPEYPRGDQRPVVTTTVPARPDGSADLVWTATETRVDGLWIQSRSADGTLSTPRWLRVSVDDAAPTVTRTGSTAAGTSSTFTAHSSMADIVDYVATLNSDDSTKQVLRPAANGKVTFSFKTMVIGHNYVNVVARNAAGVQTERGAQVWTTTDEPQVSSVEFPENGSGRLATGTFTFSSYLPDTVGYHYSMNSGSYVTVPARADGTAQVTWTPTAEGAHRLRVFRIKADTHWSRTFKDHLFAVANAVTTVASVAPGTVPSGDLRTITIDGTQLHQDDKVEVTPYRTVPIRAWVKTVSADRRTLTVEVDLSHALLGPATLTLHPYGTLKPVVLANAFTIGPPPALQSVKPPTISGTVAAGGTATVDPGEWTPSAEGYWYQWSANGVDIWNANDSTFTIPVALVGQRLTVAVTASRDRYTSTTVTSAAVAVGRTIGLPHPPTLDPDARWSKTRRPPT